MTSRWLFAVTVFVIAACAPSDNHAPDDPNIPSLSVLSIDSLRNRSYGSTLRIEEPRRHEAQYSYIASYHSDGLRVYTRVDIPSSAPPDSGYPVVIFVHGWVGIDDAPSMNFYYDSDSNYAQMIDAYVDAGFVVFVPGWRGHGTVKGVAADGVEFMQAWDNGSYLSPVFYAVDVLNLLDGLASFKTAKLNLDRINAVGHSQGGDVALIVLAVAGERSKVTNEIHASSIWSGTFPSRFTQLETYWPMQASPEAFMSGDGSWNGTAVGADGQVNERFVFGYPTDWIGTVNVDEWTWQKDAWSIPNVPDAIIVKLDQMYNAINTYVGEIDDADYKMARSDGPAFAILHDPRVGDAMRQIGAYDQERFLTEPLALQHSDRDFYSFPEWNNDLCQRINSETSGTCCDFEYPQNTHSLQVSEHRWFSSETAIPGFFYAIQRDIALFQGADPAEINFP